MNYSSLWAKTTVTKNIATEALYKYGHILRWKNRNGRVLEIGCGDGSLTRTVLYPYVKNRIEKLIATDKLQQMIDYANKYNEVQNITFEVMDATNAEEVKKRKANFDHVFSFHTAHWIPDHRTFIGGLHRMLEPDGQIFIIHVVTSPVHLSFHRLFTEGTWSKYIPQERALMYYTDDPVEYIRKIVKEVGFNVEVCEHEKKKDPIVDYIDFKRVLISMHPHLDRIPPELREDFFQDNLKHILQNSTYLGEPNVYEMKYEILTCVASK